MNLIFSIRDIDLLTGERKWDEFQPIFNKNNVGDHRVPNPNIDRKDKLLFDDVINVA